MATKKKPLVPPLPTEYPPTTIHFAPPAPGTATKIGPQRTTKVTQKLKLLPEDKTPSTQRTPVTAGGGDHDPLAQRDIERLFASKERIAKFLPRVTAYCTASSYRMEGLMRFLQSRASTRSAAPQLFDEVIYSPYSYTGVDASPPAPDLINLEMEGLHGMSGERPLGIVSEVFLFEYGVTVIWGMTEAEELRFLKEIAKFEVESLPDDSREDESFNYFVTTAYPPRVYNDVFIIRDAQNYMIKLSISHAIAQSVKISLFEELVENTIELTKDIPETVAATGKVSMSRKKIMMSVGELFILRISQNLPKSYPCGWALMVDINLVGSVLDSPELMWAEPKLQPTYEATRIYLEINQRVQLLNQKVDVISDLLQMLKQQMTHSHSEYLEWIVIILIAAEIFIALVNILVDSLSGA